MLADERGCGGHVAAAGVVVAVDRAGVGDAVSEGLGRVGKADELVRLGGDLATALQVPLCDTLSHVGSWASDAASRCGNVSAATSYMAHCWFQARDVPPTCIVLCTARICLGCRDVCDSATAPDGSCARLLTLVERWAWQLDTSMGLHAFPSSCRLGSPAGAAEGRSWSEALCDLLSSKRVG
jgi:hypothetical protein